eukprot:8968650-Lingulodinium_polyedra.AAC.1
MRGPRQSALTRRTIGGLGVGKGSAETFVYVGCPSGRRWPGWTCQMCWRFSEKRPAAWVSRAPAWPCRFA